MGTPHKFEAEMKAYAEGAAIEWKSKDTAPWSLNKNPPWAGLCQYRVKPGEIVSVATASLLHKKGYSLELKEDDEEYWEPYWQPSCRDHSAATFICRVADFEKGKTKAKGYSEDEDDYEPLPPIKLTPDQKFLLKQLAICRQAQTEGVKVQHRSADSFGTWCDTRGDKSWILNTEYRVKPGEVVSNELGKLLQDNGYSIECYETPIGWKKGLWTFIGVCKYRVAPEEGGEDAHEGRPESEKAQAEPTLMPLNALTKQIVAAWECEERHRFIGQCEFMKISPTEQFWQLWLARASQHNYTVTKEGVVVYAK